MMNTVFNKLRNLDAYPKVNDDFYSRTLFGGIITLVSSLAILLLVFSEFTLYLHTVTETKLLVDTSRGKTFHINFDVTFPAIPCTLLSVDTMDISGEQHHDIKHDIIKKRINAHGDVIESRPDGIGAPKIEKPLQRHGGRLEKMRHIVVRALVQSSQMMTVVTLVKRFVRRISGKGGQ